MEPPPGAKRRSKSRISVIDSRRPKRVRERASRSASRRGPWAVSRVKGGTSSLLAPVARAWIRSRYAPAYTCTSSVIWSSPSAFAYPMRAMEAENRLRSQVKGPTYASSKSFTLKISRPLASMNVPKFSACRSPWIHAGGALVQVRAAPLLGVEVVVEEGGRAPVEREGRGRHLPELH